MRNLGNNDVEKGLGMVDTATAGMRATGRAELTCTENEELRHAWEGLLWWKHAAWATLMRNPQAMLASSTIIQSTA